MTTKVSPNMGKWGGAVETTELRSPTSNFLPSTKYAPRPVIYSLMTGLVWNESFHMRNSQGSSNCRVGGGGWWWRGEPQRPQGSPRHWISKEEQGGWELVEGGGEGLRAEGSSLGQHTRAGTDRAPCDIESPLAAFGGGRVWGSSGKEG